MARVFVTGSADGLGLAAARRLLDAGHEVALHARNAERAEDIRRAEPRAKTILVGDLASIAEVRSLAGQADDTGRFDAVIHNAGIGYTAQRRVETADGLERHFAVNVLAPYLLTALMTRPDRLVYLTSGMHQGGRPDLDDPQWTSRRWSGSGAYSDTKLLDVVLDPGRRAALDRRAGQLRGPGLGGHPDGRRGRARRPRRGHAHPGLAGHQRRSGRHRDRPLLLPPEGPRAARRHETGRAPGRAARLLRGADRDTAARMSVRVLCAGLSTVDLLYRVDRIPGVDEKAQAESVEIGAGGPALNAAVTAAALGADVTLLTAVGAPSAGRADPGRPAPARGHADRRRPGFGIAAAAVRDHRGRAGPADHRQPQRGGRRGGS